MGTDGSERKTGEVAGVPSESLRHDGVVEAQVVARLERAARTADDRAVPVGDVLLLHPVDHLLGHRRDAETEVQKHVAGVLGHLKDREAVPALIHSLSDSSPVARME